MISRVVCRTVVRVPYPRQWACRRAVEHPLHLLVDRVLELFHVLLGTQLGQLVLAVWLVVMFGLAFLMFSHARAGDSL